MKLINQFYRRIETAICQLPAGFYWPMRLITSLASVVITGLVLVWLSWLVYAQASRPAFKIIITIIATIGSCGLLKNLIRRSRPDSEYSQQMFFKTYSFPSGHASSAMAVYGSLAYWWVDQLSSSAAIAVIMGLASLIMIIGVSRVYLRAHYLSDVLAGWLLGGLVLIVINCLF